jgi:hypothetical protein
VALEGYRVCVAAPAGSDQGPNNPCLGRSETACSGACAQHGDASVAIRKWLEASQLVKHPR